MDWKLSVEEQKEVGNNKRTDKKSERKMGLSVEKNRLLSSFVSFCLSGDIIDQAKMWIDYAVTASVIPLLNGFHI